MNLLAIGKSAEDMHLSGTSIFSVHAFRHNKACAKGL